MKNKKNKIIAAALVIFALAAAFFMQNGGKGDPLLPSASSTASFASANTQDVKDESPSQAAGINTQKSDSTPENAVTAVEPDQTPRPAAEPKAAAEPKPEKTAQAVPDPASAQKPDQKTLTCTLSINCSSILNNMGKLTKGKESLVPSDGRILNLTDVEFEAGNTVFYILQRELQKRNMHIEFSTSPMYGSVYMEGICNLYEFDCGELSGWMYSVNGVFPSCSCSQYTLSDGDAIAWVYTCDLGNDAGKGY